VSLAREPNVTSVSCKKQQKDGEWHIILGIKESPFAGKAFSNEKIFSIIRVVLVP
jgi:hypothetical protein